MNFYIHGIFDAGIHSVSSGKVTRIITDMDSIVVTTQPAGSVARGYKRNSRKRSKKCYQPIFLSVY